MENQIIDFIRDEIKELKQELKTVDGKVDQLLEFKWKIIGGTVLASLLLTGVFQVLMIYIKLNKGE